MAPKQKKTSAPKRSSRRASQEHSTLHIEWMQLPYLIVALAAVLLSLALFMQQQMVAQSIQKDTYQAVFLTNGQVYFGQMTKINRSYMRLDNVFYLQQSDLSQAAEETNDTNFAIFPLGSEIHAPQSQLLLNSDHILMWENLERTSPIIEAIAREQ